MLALLCSIWVVLAIVKGQGGPGGGGPGGQECVLLITSPIYVCEDDVSKSYVSTDNLETIRHNESLTYVRGNIEMMKTFDPTTRVEIILNKISNGKKEAVLTLEISLCDELERREESDYYKLLQYLGFPPDCPIEPGSYPIHDLVADMDDLPINSANIGDYECTMNFIKCEDAECKERTLEACVKLDCVIEAS